MSGSDRALIIMVIGCAFLFGGTPDVTDGVVNWLMNQGCKQ
jgi:hypothetical protein